MIDAKFSMFDNTNIIVNNNNASNVVTSGGGGGDSVQDAFVEGSHLWSLLVVGYSLVFAVGVIGNVVLLAALCGTGSRARALPVRNHLMVNLAAADLLVTAICVPISACAAASHACWPGFLVSWMCQLGPLLQRTPVAASTLSLALLSLDRWAAIRHPRFAQRFRDRRFVAMSMVSIWILASLVAAPTVWARQWNENPLSVWTATAAHQTMMELDKTNSSDWGEQWSQGGVCVERWTNMGIQVAYAATYLGTAFVSPALIVAACHASVSHKLTTQLQVLSGGAASGDKLASRPRPKQVIIVARDPSNNIIPNPLNPLQQQGAVLGTTTAEEQEEGQEGAVVMITTTTTKPNGGDGANNNGTTKNNSLAVSLCPSGGGVAAGGTAPSTTPAPGMLDHHRPSCKLVPCDPNSDDDDVYIRMQIEADLESFRQLSQLQHSHNNASQGSYRGVKSLTTPRSGRLSNASVNGGTRKNSNSSTLRAARRETSIIRAHRKLRKKLAASSTASHHGLSLGKGPPPLLPTYSSQSFRSRRRAANLLAALAGVFVFCWAPYVACALWEMFVTEKSLVRLLIPFALFLGHAHSAINPVVSWRLNRSAFVRFQRHTFLSFLPNWNFLRSCRTCTSTCCGCCVYSLRNPCFCCCPRRAFPGSTSGGSSDNRGGEGRRAGGTMHLQHNYQHRTTQQQPTVAGTGSSRFLTVPNHLTVPNPTNRHQHRAADGGGGYSPRHNSRYAPRESGSSCSNCFRRSGGDYPDGRNRDDEEGIPCCCCFCPAGGPFGRRSSSPDPWNWNNSSTNEAALGAFHPRYLNRLPVPQPDQISKCHTSHFLR